MFCTVTYVGGVTGSVEQSIEGELSALQGESWSRSLSDRSVTNNLSAAAAPCTEQQYIADAPCCRHIRSTLVLELIVVYSFLLSIHTHIPFFK